MTVVAPCRVVLEPIAGSVPLPDRLRAPARAVAFASLTATMLVGARLHQSLVQPERRVPVFAAYQHAWYRALLDLFAVQVALAGDPSAGISPNRGRLVVANHRSTLDVAVLGWLFGGRLLSRADVAAWPLLGAAARAAGTIFVEREQRTSGANAVRAIRGALREGSTIALFPEGTTHTDDVVRPFRRGAFTAAADAGAIVVPVGLAYDASGQAVFGDESFAAHAVRVASAPRITVAVRIGAPLGPAPSVTALAGAATEAVQRLVTVARLDCDALEARAQ